MAEHKHESRASARPPLWLATGLDDEELVDLIEGTMDAQYSEANRRLDDLSDAEAEMANRRLLKMMNQGERCYQLGDRVVGYVDNGGFAYYLGTEWAYIVPMAIDAFRTIGATAHAKLLKAACDVFPDYTESDRDARASLLHANPKTIARLDKLDDKFHALDGTRKSWTTVLAAYIRAHPAEFFEDEPVRRRRGAVPPSQEQTRWQSSCQDCNYIHREMTTLLGLWFSDLLNDSGIDAAKSRLASVRALIPTARAHDTPLLTKLLNMEFKVALATQNAVRLAALTPAYLDTLEQQSEIYQGVCTVAQACRVIFEHGDRVDALEIVTDVLDRTQHDAYLPGLEDLVKLLAQHEAKWVPNDEVLTDLLADVSDRFTEVSADEFLQKLPRQPKKTLETLAEQLKVEWRS